ncbi:MAG: DUF1428 family protein [Opitutales bacterium]|nr:DUF1428 family protein [Opitutales bacterium]
MSKYIETVGHDLRPCAPEAKAPTEILGTLPGETLILSYIVYKSREHRDAVNATVMDDPRMAEA